MHDAIRVTKDEHGHEATSWAVQPVPDATIPEIVGSRGQRLRFFTQAELDDVYAGCRRAGLRVVGVKGRRSYGAILHDSSKGPDGSVQHMIYPTGTAREVDEAGRWVGDPQVEGFYIVSCMMER